jgi:signal transduction histidine kinase
MHSQTPFGNYKKIRSFLSELVENSLKHNPEQADLEINIASKDVVELPKHLVKPMETRTSNMLAQKKYLAIIYCDNGKGIPKDKKAWILQPLTTTAEEGKGSGLGLFIIRKTLIEMKGYMIEKGIKGARFEIYIPYYEEKEWIT